MKKYIFFISQNYSFAILRPIQKVLLARNDEVKWFLEGKDINKEYLAAHEKRINTIDEIFEYKPDAILATANNLPSFLPGLKVAIFHGFDAGKLDNRGRNDHFKIRGGFDLYCTQGPNTTDTFMALQRQMGFFNVIETGWPALDPLFEVKPEITSSNKPTVLFCSTFSRKLSCAENTFETIKKLSESGKWQWIVQFHPKMEKTTIDKYKSIQSEHLSYIHTDNVIPLLEQADVMVCDTSSVIIMFLMQKKPVVTINNISPASYLLNITDPEKLEQSIFEALTKPPELMNNIRGFIDETHPYTDGCSAKRVVDAIEVVLLGKHPLKVKKPINILRNFKFRKRLNYWKF